MNKVVDLNQSSKNMRSRNSCIAPCDLFAQTFRFRLPQGQAKWSVLGVLTTLLLIATVVGSAVIKHSLIG